MPDDRKRTELLAGYIDDDEVEAAFVPETVKKHSPCEDNGTQVK